MKKRTIILGLIIIVIVCIVFSVINGTKNNAKTTNNATSVQSQDFIADMTNLKTSAYKVMAENPAEGNKIFYGYLEVLQNKINDFNVALPDDIKNASTESEISISTQDAYKNIGISFVCKNNSCEAIPDYQVLLQYFYNVLPAQYRIYLSLLSEDYDNPVITDENIIVPFEVIRKRILKYENFYKKYPEFPNIKDIKEKTDFYYYIYKNGVGESQIDCSLSVQNGKYGELYNIKESYSRFLDEYNGNDTKYYNEIKACYERMKSAKPVSKKETKTDFAKKFAENELEYITLVKNEKNVNKRSEIFKSYIYNIKQDITDFNNELCGDTSCSNLSSSLNSTNDGSFDINGIKIAPEKVTGGAKEKLTVQSSSIPMIYIMKTDNSSYQVAVSYDYLNKKYSKYLPAGWNEYLTYKSRPERELPGGSVFYNSSVDELINDVNIWQGFLTKYPDFIMKSDIIGELNTDYYNAFVSLCYPDGVKNQELCDKVLHSIPVNTDLYKNLAARLK